MADPHARASRLRRRAPDLFLALGDDQARRRLLRVPLALHRRLRADLSEKGRGRGLRRHAVLVRRGSDRPRRNLGRVHPARADRPRPSDPPRGVRHDRLHHRHEPHRHLRPHGRRPDHRRVVRRPVRIADHGPARALDIHARRAGPSRRRPAVPRPPARASNSAAPLETRGRRPRARHHAHVAGARRRRPRESRPPPGRRPTSPARPSISPKSFRAACPGTASRPSPRPG